jgi:type I restriction enzyme S subunit
MKWQLIPLGEVASLERRSLLPEEIKSGSNYLGLEHIESGGRILTYQKVEPGELQSNKFIFDDKTLLYGKLRPYLAKVCIPDREGCCSTDILPIRPSEKLDIGYLKHLLLWKPYVDKATSLCTGANLPRISPSSLLGIEIPLPPLEEQRRIAAILDKSDRLASLQARASIIGKEWVGSVFSECFTDSESYIEISIEEALKSQLLLLHKDGNHGSSYPRAEDFGTDGVPFISAKSIDDSGEILDSLVARLSEEKAQSLRIGWLESGDVLLAHNASVGKTALYEGQYQRALIGTSLTAFRPNPNHLNSHYLLHYLSSPSFQGSLAADMSQTTRNQVPITAQRRLALRIPPLSKQEEFAARAMSADRLSGKRRQSFRCVNSLRKSLFGALLSP